MASTSTKQHIPVFVSSTYKDLSAHRVEVEKRLVGLEQIVKGMEYFGSSPDTPLETCLKKLDESKLMILIVGVSYGSIVPDTQQSFTEVEYEYAMKHNIPVLVYIADTSSTNIGIPIDSFDTQHYDELVNFKEKLKKIHTVSFFTSIEDLGSHIERDVPEVLTKIDNIEINNIKIDDTLSLEVSEATLKDGAVKFEQFWLRPSKFVSNIVPLRLRINKKWSGWKVKDELIKVLGLDVGDTISTEVTIELTRGIIDDDDDTDLFASGEAADWLIEDAAMPGSVIDCYVRFSYCKAPVGKDGKMINKVSLILVKAIRYVRYDKNYALSIKDTDLNELLTKLRNQK